MICISYTVTDIYTSHVPFTRNCDKSNGWQIEKSQRQFSATSTEVSINQFWSQAVRGKRQEGKSTPTESTCEFENYWHWCIRFVHTNQWRECKFQSYLLREVLNLDTVGIWTTRTFCDELAWRNFHDRRSSDDYDWTAKWFNQTLAIIQESSSSISSTVQIGNRLLSDTWISKDILISWRNY